jgi:DNA-binding MarR family transcriptional regulator
MIKINSSLNFLLNLAKFQTVVSRRFDGRLGGGIGFNDFMILFYLSQAEDEKMRRIDLADKIGLTASGVTRLLAPMEKIGLIQREANTQDARVSYVMLAPGGKNLLVDRIEKAEMLTEEIIPETKIKKVEQLSDLIIELSRITN